MRVHIPRNNLPQGKQRYSEVVIQLPPEKLTTPCSVCSEQSAYCTTKRKDNVILCENCYRKQYVIKEATRKRWLWEHKSLMGCALCDEDDPRCLDYHHVHPKKKKFSIGSVSSSIPTKAIMIEISKCIVVCANCHRKVEAFLKED